MALFRKWLVNGCLTLLCVLLLVVSLAPPVLRWQVKSWLEAQGLVAEFQHMSVSLGRGRVEFAGITGRDAQGAGFGLQRLVLDMALLPLLNQQLVVESFELDSLSLDVVRLPGDTLIGGLSLANLTARAIDQPAAEPDSTLEAALDWSLSIERLRVADLEFCMAKESAGRERLARHCLSVAGVATEGGLLVPSLQSSSLQLARELTVFGLRVDDSENSLKVLSIDALGVRGVNFVPEQLQLQHFSLQGLALLERQSEVAERFEFHVGLGDLQLQKLLWRPQALDIESLGLSDLTLLLHRDRSAQLVLMSWMERLLGQLEQPSDTPAVVIDPMPSAAVPAGQLSAEQAPEAPTTVHLQHFVINGDSSINVLDEAVQPRLEQALSDVYLELNNIDSRDIQQGSELKLTARAGEFGSLALGGKLWPFRDTLNMDLAGHVEALDLLPFSACLEHAIGYQVQTGQLNLQLALVAKQDVLDARAELELDRLYLQTLSAALEGGSVASVRVPAAVASSDTSGGETTLLPIGVALNLLRDSDDKIQLALPVSGHVDEPNLSVAHVLGVVMRKAMTAAVLNYYAPFGLIDLATMLAKSATALQFEPFLFAPGAVDISRAQKPRLDKFSQLLAEKPQLSMSLCGSASGADALHLVQLQQVPEAGLILTPEQRQQLRDLVSLRLKGVKSRLLQQGASARQVVLCQPVLALDKFTDAEVDVSL